MKGINLDHFASIRRCAISAYDDLPTCCLATDAGIDDVFVLVNILRNFLEDPKLKAMNTFDDLVPEREMRLAVALAGPSVVLTTFSVLAAFFISSLVSLFREKGKAIITTSLREQGSCKRGVQD